MTTKPSPNHGAIKQARYRAAQLKLGRRGRVYFLTDAEKTRVDAFVAGLRAPSQ